MKVAVNEFINTLGQKNVSKSEVRIILGDMNELGSNSSTYHVELGAYLKKLGVQEPTFIGRFAQDYAKGFEQKSLQFENALEYRKNQFKNDKKTFKYFFLKGSRSLQLESIIDIR
jgi:UDP-N-acetylmuramoyl-tripeptide--D-alanyl-D-alanine ligase